MLRSTVTSEPSGRSALYLSTRSLPARCACGRFGAVTTALTVPCPASAAAPLSGVADTARSSGSVVSAGPSPGAVVDGASRWVSSRVSAGGVLLLLVAMRLVPSGSGAEDAADTDSGLAGENRETGVELDPRAVGRLGLELAEVLDHDAAVGQAGDPPVALVLAELDDVDRGGVGGGPLGLGGGEDVRAGRGLARVQHGDAVVRGDHLLGEGLADHLDTTQAPGAGLDTGDGPGVGIDRAVRAVDAGHLRDAGVQDVEEVVRSGHGLHAR